MHTSCCFERYLLFRFIFLIGFLFSAYPTFAEVESVSIDTNPNQFLVLFPELKTAPSPSWITIGKRFTYYYQYAGRFNPNEDTPTSGNGYFQFDVVALTARNSVASLKTYINNGKGYLISTSTTSSVQPLGLGEFWIAPSVLVHAENVANPNLAVVRMTKTIGNKVYRCVRFQSTLGDNSAEYVWMFQETTGKLIYYSSRRGNPTNPDHLWQASLVNERVLPLPWNGIRAPLWVTTITPWSLNYTGTQKIEYLSSYPSSPIYLGYRINLVRTRYQPIWSEYRITDDLYASLTGWVNQSSVDSVTGISQLSSPLWLPPEAFSAANRWGINKFVILDTDPITKTTVLGLHASNGDIMLREKGTETQKGPIYQINTYYRQSDGKLTKFARTDIMDLLTTFMMKTVNVILRE